MKANIYRAKTLANASVVLASEYEVLWNQGLAIQEQNVNLESDLKQHKADKSILLALIEHIENNTTCEATHELCKSFMNDSLWEDEEDYVRDEMANKFLASLRGLVLDGKAAENIFSGLAETYIK